MTKQEKAAWEEAEAYAVWIEELKSRFEKGSASSEDIEDLKRLNIISCNY